MDLQTRWRNYDSGWFCCRSPDQDIDDVIFGARTFAVVDDEGRVIALITRTDLAGCL